MNLYFLLLTTLFILTIGLTDSSDINDILYRLSNVNPNIFEYFSDGKIKYIHAQEEYNKHEKYNLKDDNCLIKQINLIINKIEKFKETLVLVGTFIREHLFHKSGKNLIAFPDVPLDTELSVKCTRSAWDCIEEVARKAKNFSKDENYLFDYKTTASYYLCWYTLNLHPLFSQMDYFFCTEIEQNQYYGYFSGSSVDFLCAQTCFCPDICCGKAFKRARASYLPLKTYEDFAKECKKSRSNPCYEIDDGTCELSTTNNKNLAHLRENKLNVTCKCPEGKKYSNEYSKCVDLDECAELKHECHAPNQLCLNTIGSYECVCEQGYRLTQNKCVPHELFDNDERVYESSVRLDELERV